MITDNHHDCIGPQLGKDPLKLVVQVPHIVVVPTPNVRFSFLAHASSRTGDVMAQEVAIAQRLRGVTGKEGSIMNGLRIRQVHVHEMEQQKGRLILVRLKELQSAIDLYRALGPVDAAVCAPAVCHVKIRGQIHVASDHSRGPSGFSEPILEPIDLVPALRVGACDHCAGRGQGPRGHRSSLCEHRGILSPPVELGAGLSSVAVQAQGIRAEGIDEHQHHLGCIFVGGEDGWLGQEHVV